MTREQQALMVRVFRYIIEHPEQHNQAMFGEETECGTCFCFAGHAALMAGWKPVWSAPYFIAGEQMRDLDGVTKGRRHESAYKVARSELGIEDGEAARLFLWAFDLNGVRVVVTSLLGFDPTGPEADALLAEVSA